MKRKQVSLKDRLTPCQFCEYPISQVHHALPFSTYGENAFKLHLCGNCHELYHIVRDVYENKNLRSLRLLMRFQQIYGEDDIRLEKAYHFIANARNIENLISTNPNPTLDDLFEVLP